MLPTWSSAALFVVLLLSANLNATDADEMMRIVTNIKSTFSSYYAPKDWKTKKFAWSLEDEMAKLNEASARGDTNAFHQGLLTFFDAARDYHTSISFADNTVATLPISIKYIDGGFYLAYVAPSIARTFSLRLGDKITHFNDRDVEEIAYQIMGKLREPSLTDWALAARSLTKRTAMALQPIEKGSVVIRALRSDQPVVGQVVWNVNYGWQAPQSIRSMTSSRKPSSPSVSPFMATLSADQQAVVQSMHQHIKDRSFRTPLADQALLATDLAGDPQGIAKKTSFLPPLGERVVWQAESGNPWNAYIYQDPDKRLIGFIRIASYSPDESAGGGDVYVQKFGEIMTKMDEMTDALVIDQTNNPGGSVFYLYALASILADKPLKTPRHSFTIDSRDAYEARDYLKQADSVISLAEKSGEAGTSSGYPVDAQFLMHMKSYYQFIVEQWSQGKTLTDPYFLFGVDYIMPHPQYRYRKPIVLLVNELDFSGGDFFPAIMQDNERVVVVGTTTAGAGGYVVTNTDRNRAGIFSYSYTSSIAFRANGEPLENLGVTPDIYYQVTPTDLSTNFAGMVGLIHHVVSLLRQN